jgi:hypothetical protein
VSPLGPRSAWLLAGALGVALGVAGAGCGRTLSRLGLGAQKLRAPKGAQQVLSVAFHKDADATIKDVVFLMDDCTVVAREYRDVSPFEGEVRIVSDDGSPFHQAGCVPRPR